MPYTIEQHGDQYCVYLEVDGSASGDSLGCHDSREDAERQRAAIIAAEEDATTAAIKRVAGDTVKDLGNGKIGGYLVRFSTEDDPDLEGEYFDPQTDFAVDFEHGPVKTAVYFDHGYDATLGKRVIGAGDMRRDDVGVWIEAQLSLRDRYERAIYELAQAGKLGWSSGTASHLADVETGDKARRIKRWPLGLDASLTATPAEPRNDATVLKTTSTATFDPGDYTPDEWTTTVVTTDAVGHTEGDADGTPEAQPSAVDVDRDVPADKTDAVEEVTPMTEHTEQAPPVEENETPAMKALRDQLAEQTTKIDALTKLIEDSPALERAGYSTNYGGTNDATHKSFGDWLLAVKRGDHRRLVELYGSRKTLEEDGGGTGGYLVPTEYRAELLAVQVQQSPIVAAVQRIPVNSRAGEWPALDNYTAPTAGVGNTAFAGGLTTAARAESGSYTETEPTFEMLEWNVHSNSGITYISKELSADSPMAIEALLRQVIAVAVNAKEEYYILRGTGAGEPLGILNAACAIGITPATNNAFAWADALGMKARFKSTVGMPMWAIHPGIWPDIGVFETSAGGGVFQANMADGLHQTLLGYRIVESEHLPQDDNSGAVILGDFAAYLLFVRGGLEISFSEHVAFANGRIAWRFDERLDGQPWLKSAITLADPQGSYTVSSFVYHND